MRSAGAGRRRELGIGLGLAALALAGVSTATAVLIAKEEPAPSSVVFAAQTAPSRAAVPSATRKTDAGPVLARDSPVPILMYHVIADPPPSSARAGLYINPADFAGQMRWLARNGYTAVTLRTVWDHWHGHTRLPFSPVVITFDDGTRSIAVRAGPQLAAYGWPGVLNLDLSNLEVSWGLSPERVRGLIEAGWEVNSHTLTHPDLTGLNATRLQLEVAGSRSALRRRFQVPVDFFCYPSGRFDDRVVAAVKAAGYRGAMTAIDGLARPSDP